jgi:hypothetical protein
MRRVRSRLSRPVDVRRDLFAAMRGGVGVADVDRRASGMTHDAPSRVTTPHDWARSYADGGLVLIPLHTDTKVPARAWKQYQDRRPERSELAAWWPNVEHVPYGFAVVTGHLSGLTVIDADGPMATAVVRGVVGDDDRVPLVRTTKGLHAWFRFSGERNRAGVMRFSDGSQIDRRGEGGYVAVPPTPGKHWERHAPRQSWQPVPPGWGPSAADERPARPLRVIDGGQAPTWTQAIPQGQRHDTLVRIAGGMVARGCTPDDVLAELHRVNALHCSPPLDARELEVELHGIASSIGGWS